MEKLQRTRDVIFSTLDDLANRRRPDDITNNFFALIHDFYSTVSASHNEQQRITWSDMTDREKGIAQRTTAALRDPLFVAYRRFIMNHAREPNTALGLLLFRCELLPELASGLDSRDKKELLQSERPEYYGKISLVDVSNDDVTEK
ncbi:hypothetical protein PRIPAC_90521 [Pristionchus pacificus]|uniref:Uncharacterized protein n=1 Tax=Pristionchus pacificus TaxID=54126 RepID=A0A2A6CWH5_PRIPA|nr:hypothetical protein PRIPAC_90521 [Pristionchus pacificus]|eukprot:PDM82436.1 hypothetical protein PRIPAC_36829 [Pristionchus pacificus]